jgi:hypothetical protein
VEQDRAKQLMLLKEKFRSLPLEDRESLGISLLKINLGVHSERDIGMVQGFLDGLKIQLDQGHLDGFMEYLHSPAANVPNDGSMAPTNPEYTEKLKKHYSQSIKSSELDLYDGDEDGVETLKEPVDPKLFQ